MVVKVERKFIEMITMMTNKEINQENHYHHNNKMMTTTGQKESNLINKDQTLPL